MRTPMKVDFDDIEENWRLWGELVELWIYDLHPKPTDAGKLVNQMTAHGIQGARIDCPVNREVKVIQYGNDDPLIILIPTADMLKDGRKTAVPGQSYPLPVFYDAAYTGPRKVFDADADTLFAACRIGEYTINMCM